MSMIPAGSEVNYVVTYLEMCENPNLSAPALPPEVRLEHALNPPVWMFFTLYDAVGHDYEWRDKHGEDPAEVASFVQDPKVEMWVAYAHGWPQGFFMLDFREQGTCDLAYFGMVPEAVGKGIGGRLLNTALAKGWNGAGVERMTVNTCTLDHPRALALYQRAGFVPMRSEDLSRVLTRDRDPARLPD